MPADLSPAMERALELAKLHGTVSSGRQAWYGAEPEIIHGGTIIALGRRALLIVHGSGRPNDPVWGHPPPHDSSCGHCARVVAAALRPPP